MPHVGSKETHWNPRGNCNQATKAGRGLLLFFPSDRRKWKVRRWGRLLNCQGEIKDMKAFLSILSIHLSTYLFVCLSVWILFSDLMSRLHMHTTQNQSRGKSCHQSGGCYSRLSSPLLLCKTKLHVCVCVCYGFYRRHRGNLGPDTSSCIRWMFLVSEIRALWRTVSVFLFLSCCSADKAVTRSLKQTLPRAPDDSGSGRSEAEPLGQFNRKIRKRGIIDGADLVCLTLTWATCRFGCVLQMLACMITRWSGFQRQRADSLWPFHLPKHRLVPAHEGAKGARCPLSDITEYKICN